VLKNLIDDCNVDINKRGDGIGDPVGRFEYWGTPLRYAVSSYRGTKVFYWLLERRAALRFGKGDGHFDAWWVARFQGNVKV
jgi:hypothetical protein